MAVGSVGSWHNACISQRCKQRTSARRQDVPFSALQMLFTEMTHSEDESLCGELEWHEERYHNNAIIVLMVTSYNRGVNISSINRCGVGKTQKARAETQRHVKSFCWGADDVCAPVAMAILHTWHVWKKACCWGNTSVCALFVSFIWVCVISSDVLLR